ncbi:MULTISPECIES: hypothetical protein [Thalassospira]|uniref:Uncharacterized protein n=1 Tax=Thalassospira profundimaris TaxID=502049 RepID=A0A367V4L5_9PROT|nr:MULTISPECIES: hypothetical protein [Thalassospira]KZB72460.1 hypothetical protein AUQ43_20005 [Thalassospira sp. MCCC 1A01148]MBR9902318.1 hypothetical protein [Rhodospirillales bacterium]RCK20148.1 hypothetical protein TH6_16855 [Thalassospira profundimaris]
MRRLLIILCLILAGSIFVAWPTMALDQDDTSIRDTARDIRLKISDLDQQLKEHLRRALEEFGTRPVECTTDQPRKSLSKCIEEDARDLTRTTITIASSGGDDADLLDDLADTEERFALFTREMNKTNDLLARAGAKLYLTGLDVAPEMDQLRRDVIVFIERKQAYELRTKQALLIATVAIILIAIFSLIFAVIQRFR